MKSKNWLQRQKKDIYVKKAKNEGYLSRSSYKLIQIDNTVISLLLNTIYILKAIVLKFINFL